MKRFLFFLLLLLPFVSNAEKVRVRLFSNNKVELIYVSFDLGQYDLFADSVLLEPSLGEGMSVELKPAAEGVTVSVNGYLYGTFRQAILRATDTACIMRSSEAVFIRRDQQKSNGSHRVTDCRGGHIPGRDDIAEAAESLGFCPRKRFYSRLQCLDGASVVRRRL